MTDLATEEDQLQVSIYRYEYIFCIYVFFLVKEAFFSRNKKNRDFTQVGFAELKETVDDRANIGGTIIGAPIIGQ